MQDLGHWHFSGTIPSNSLAFVYKITEKSTGNFYIGFRNMFSHRTLKPLKNTYKKRKVTKESDWRTYCSSSGVWKDKIENNKQLFFFEILQFFDDVKKAKIEETVLICRNIYNKKCQNRLISLKTTVSEKEKL